MAKIHQLNFKSNEYIVIHLPEQEKGMGIVQKQTIRGTAWSYLGAVLGFVNMALLSPVIFSTGEIGVVQVLLSYATLLSQFAGLGFTNVINRLFPYFRDPREKHNGFFALALIVTLAGFIVTLVGMKLYTPVFEKANLEQSPLISEYSFYIPPLLLITVLFTLLDNYNKVLYNAVLGTFLREFLFRVLNMALIILFWAGLIDFDGFMLGYIISQGIPLIVITTSLLIRGEISLKLRPGFITPALKNEIILLCLFGILTGFSSNILTTLDKVFINHYLGEGQAGIYSIASYFAILILIPGKSMARITVPFIAESWKKDDIKTIGDLYIRTSISQYAAGLLIFIGLLVNIDKIFRLLPDEYGRSEAVIILESIGNRISVAAGINGVVLNTSALYRYQTWLMLFFIGIFVGAGVIFTPLFGITGIALASMISNVIYNLLCILVTGKKFGIWPYNRAHIHMTVVAVVAAAAGYILPQFSLLPDIIVRSLLVTIIFGAGLYFGKLSEDLNNVVDKVIARVSGWLHE
jgi:O-antigen/teichoic acid export membrane protein